MKFSQRLLLVMLMTISLGMSCSVVTEADQEAIFLEKLQKKEWTLKQDILYSNSIDFTPQTFHFVSDTELVFSYEDNNGVMQTENHNYTVNFNTDNNVQFNIYIDAIALILPVAGITDNSMTIMFESGRMLDFE